jgi:hypothetical protein
MDWKYGERSGHARRSRIRLAFVLETLRDHSVSDVRSRHFRLQGPAPMTKVEIELPNELVQRARAAGLLSG